MAFLDLREIWASKEIGENLDLLDPEVRMDRKDPKEEAVSLETTDLSGR